MSETDYSYIRKGSWGDRPPANAGRDRETGELWIRIGNAQLKLTDEQGHALLDALDRVLGDAALARLDALLIDELKKLENRSLDEPIPYTLTEKGRQ